MNTSAKGAAYENAFKAELYRRGAMLVVRAAASKGPFDLLSVDAITTSGYQMKTKTTCWEAERLTLRLLEETQTWEDGKFMPYVVHRTKEKEFCEH